MWINTCAFLIVSPRQWQILGRKDDPIAPLAFDEPDLTDIFSAQCSIQVAVHSWETGHVEF